MEEEANRKDEGHTVGFYLPAGIAELCERARKKLGLNRSKFFQYCVLKTLQDLSLLTSEVHKNAGDDDIKIGREGS